MEFVFFIPFLMIAMPLGCGLAARESGYSFWKWAFIGTLLPGLAFCLLYWVMVRDERAQQDAETGPLLAPSENA